MTLRVVRNVGIGLTMLCAAFVFSVCETNLPTRNCLVLCGYKFFSVSKMLAISLQGSSLVVLMAI